MYPSFMVGLVWKWEGNQKEKVVFSYNIVSSVIRSSFVSYWKKGMDIVFQPSAATCFWQHHWGNWSV